jgi:hypothetical protein
MFFLIEHKMGFSPTLAGFIWCLRAAGDKRIMNAGILDFIVRPSI